MQIKYVGTWNGSYATYVKIHYTFVPAIRYICEDPFHEPTYLEDPFHEPTYLEDPFHEPTYLEDPFHEPTYLIVYV